MRARWKLLALYFVILSLAVMTTHPVHACGWWGDGEVERDSIMPVLNAPDGTALEQSISLRSAKLPGEMGYGIAVPDPGRAIPYLLTTFGRPVNRIGELKTYGFETVIDLGTPNETARLHRAETEAAGMVYFNIPINGDMPSKAQVERFRDMVVASSDAPVLVYAPTAPLLGVMWAAYRISFGAPLGFALNEGRALGLTADQEDELRSWSR